MRSPPRPTVPVLANFLPQFMLGGISVQGTVLRVPPKLQHPQKKRRMSGAPMPVPAVEVGRLPARSPKSPPARRNVMSPSGSHVKDESMILLKIIIMILLTRLKAKSSRLWSTNAEVWA